jgi:hypothetical protein
LKEAAQRGSDAFIQSTSRANYPDFADFTDPSAFNRDQHGTCAKALLRMGQAKQGHPYSVR